MQFAKICVARFFLFQVGEVEHTAVTSEDGEDGIEWTRELRCGNENVF